MTASRRYLPASLACLVTLSAGSAAFAGGGTSGSALDPYASVQAPAGTKVVGKHDKNKKAHHAPLIKQAQAAEDKIAVDESNQSQTYVKMPGGKQGKKQKETPIAEEPQAKLPKAKKIKLAPVQSTTKVSDIAPVEPKAEKPSKVEKTAKANKVEKVEKSKVAAGQNDEGVMSGIKTIGEGYSKTFKAATHGIVSSTKAASDAMVSGSKKMGSGIKNGAKASGDAFKKGANVVGSGFKATGDKIKDSAAPITEKLAKAPAKEHPKKHKEKKEAEVKVASDKPLDTAVESKKEKQSSGGIGAKLAHLPKPKMPKLSLPFGGGKKKPAVDAAAGANEQGPAASENNVAAAPKPAPVKKVAKETPIVDDPPQTAQAPAARVKSNDKSKEAGHGLIAMPGNVTKKLGKLWPFGKKEGVSDVAGKQTPAPL